MVIAFRNYAAEVWPRAVGTYTDSENTPCTASAAAAAAAALHC